MRDPKKQLLYMGLQVITVAACHVLKSCILMEIDVPFVEFQLRMSLKYSINVRNKYEVKEILMNRHECKMHCPMF